MKQTRFYKYTLRYQTLVRSQARSSLGRRWSDECVHVGAHEARLMWRRFTPRPEPPFALALLRLSTPAQPCSSPEEPCALAVRFGILSINIGSSCTPAAPRAHHPHLPSLPCLHLSDCGRFEAKPYEADT